MYVTISYSLLPCVLIEYLEHWCFCHVLSSWHLEIGVSVDPHSDSDIHCVLSPYSVVIFPQLHLELTPASPTSLDHKTDLE